MSLQRFLIPAKRGDYMGAVGHFYLHPEANETLDFIQSLRVRFVRGDAPLMHLEDKGRLEQLGAYANSISRRRLYPIFTFTYVKPEDSVNPQHEHGAPNDAYIKRLPGIAYHAGMYLIPLGVQIAEMWNEWNYDGFFNPNDIPRYSRVLKAFSTGWRAAAAELRTNVKVLVGGMAAVTPTTGGPMAPDAFRMLLGTGPDTATAFDGVALHCTDSPYNPDDPATRNAEWNSSRVWPEKLRDMVHYIGRSKNCKVWQTEQGFFTPLNEAQAAARFTQDMRWWFSQVDSGWAGPHVTYHAQRDGNPAGSDDHGSGAAIRRQDGSEKPICAEIRRIASLDWTAKVV